MQFTFKREAIIMTILLFSPMILGLCVVFATLLFPRLGADAVAASDLRLFKTTGESRRLFADEAEREAAMNTFWNKSNADSRKQFREALEKQSFASIKNGTYLREIQESVVQCDDDPSSMPTFLMVQVVNGPHRGTLGWTCGPLKPIAKGLLVRTTGR